MDELDPTTKNPTVVKANSLIQAGYRLTIAEQRVLLAAIAQINKGDEPTDQVMYTVTAEALADQTGTTLQRSYKELADAAHRLYRREVRIEHGPNGEADGPQGDVTMTRWVQSVRYLKSEGRVALRFSRDILPYLSQLRREFTTYRLRHVATMRSTHGVRLYELLQQYRQLGERELELGELRRMFGVEGRYPSIKDLKVRVVEPAIRDVNECSDLHVDWDQRKAGRRVVALRFRFWPKEQGAKGKQKQVAAQREEAEQAHQQRLERSREKGTQQLAELMREHGLEPPEDLH